MPLSPRAARTKLEEALGKLDIIGEEATPLVIHDRDEGERRKWILAGKVQHCDMFHIQTISRALLRLGVNLSDCFFDLWEKNMFMVMFAI